MQTSGELRNALVTQKSKRQRLIYDSIQSTIDTTIQTLKTEQKNAIIRNLAYNIDGQLVVAQLFINRLNGFVPTEETRFGTMPTAYQIQLRFVHGYETMLGNKPIFISNGSFEWRNLVPHQIGDHITDDIYHEMQLITGPQVELTIGHQTLNLGIPHAAQIHVPWRQEEGQGYVTFMGGKTKYYFTMHDYEQRHKLNTVYALCYAQPDQDTLYRWHPEYRGYTEAQEGTHEPRDQNTATRLKAYRDWTQSLHVSLQNTPWRVHHEQSRLERNPYCLNIISVNGMYLYADSGLVVDRLYDYQVELVQLITEVYQRIRTQAQPNGLPQEAHRSIVDMGVGAGKTYIINTILKHASLFYRDPNYAPSFCMSPDPALADVMVRMINKQNGISQIFSTAITTEADLPDAAFLERYQEYAQIAWQEISDIKAYIDEGLQNSILEYCRENGLHPFVIMNELYGESRNCQLYQNSIDIKRLLLLIEGQKMIMQKTGLSPVIALRRLSDELEKIMIGVAKEGEKGEGLFSTITTPVDAAFPSARQQIIYNQNITLPLSLRGEYSQEQSINFSKITGTRLHQLLLTKFSYKRVLLQQTVAIRDVLLKIACLSDRNAAILLANGGGLANTHTQEELNKQIRLLLEPAAAELRRGAAKTESMNYLEHRCYFLYLNEIFATVPAEIDARSAYRTQWDRHLLSTSLSLNYRLLYTLREKIAQKLASLTQPHEIDRKYGTTVIEATDRMAGHVGLVLSGKLEQDSAKLLSTHVPIFSPEGFVAYLEYVAHSEGKPVLQVHYEAGVYRIQPLNTVITRRMIQQRLIQIFNALMLADEVHKEAYQFLYDPNHPLYQQVNRITQDYLQQEFARILPHRIGMSGTVNQIAKNAFGPHPLYSLPLQDMIQRQLTKKFHITALPHTQSPDIWADYFEHNAWWTVSKGIVFSKQAQIFSSPVREISKATHNHMLRNQLLIYYLEFMLQKNGACKELSELVGIQNTLYAASPSIDLCAALRQLNQYTELDSLQDIIHNLRHISPDLISKTDVDHYVQRALHSQPLQAILSSLILKHKNDVQAFIQELTTLNLPLEEFITADPHTFEDGLSQILLGTEAQQSGYSHEFVGTIVDASSLSIKEPFVARAHSIAEVQRLYVQLQTLLTHSFSYDEKNQIGGRALRTSSGTAHYIEYLSPYYNRTFVFNIETSFADIFIENKEQAKALRTAVMLHRLLLRLVSERDGSFSECVDYVLQYCQTHGLLAEYQGYMATCLPAWWSLKNQPERVVQQNYTDLEAILITRLQQHAQTLPLPLAPQPNNIVPTPETGWETRPRDNQLRLDPPTPLLPFSARIWLEWMTQPLPVAVAASLLLAGLGLLGALSVGLITSALLASCAKGMAITGAVLLLPALGKACYTFFQHRALDHQSTPGFAPRPNP